MSESSKRSRVVMPLPQPRSPKPYDRYIAAIRPHVIPATASFGIGIIVGFFHDAINENLVAWSAAISALAAVVVMRFTAELTAFTKRQTELGPVLERAYVRFDEERSIGGGPRIGPTSAIDVAFRNYGKTPADCGLRYARFFYHKHSVPPHPELRRHEEYAPTRALASGDHFLVGTATLEATAEEFEGAKRNQGDLYLTAKLVYTDVFGSRRETAICFSWDFGMDRFFQYDGVGDAYPMNFHT